jgi:hypothetical protein
MGPEFVKYRRQVFRAENNDLVGILEKVFKSGFVKSSDFAK